MIRVFVTGWAYLETAAGRLATNPVFDYLESLPAAATPADAIEVSAVASPMGADGYHVKATCLAIMRGPDSIDSVEIPGARKLRSFNFEQSLTVMTAAEIQAIRDYFSGYTDIDVSHIDESYTYGEAVEEVARVINPEFSGFGVSYLADSGEWA